MKETIKKLLRPRYIIALIVLLIILFFVLGGGSKKTTYEFFTAKPGDVAQTVSVTGNTKPVDTIDLSFQQSGRITGIYTDVGRLATRGQLLMELDDRDIKAQLASAEATVRSQQAKLDSLKNGTRPEDIQISETNVQKARVALQNEYTGVFATLNDAYIKSENAIQQQIDQIVGSPNGTAPQLTFAVNSSQVKNDVEGGWTLMVSELALWKTQLSKVTSTAAPADLEAALKLSQTHMSSVLVYLSRVMDAVTGNTALDQTTANTYKTNVTTAKTNVNTSLSAVLTKMQTIENNKVAVSQALDQLALSRAGSTPEDIAAQTALVEQARASAESLRAQLSKYTIYSPIDGIVAKQDGKLGEVAGANQSLVSVISGGNLQIEANIPEVDIGKIAVGNKVDLSFDAFPGTAFDGSVITIDPAETVVDGVVNYKIKVLVGADPTKPQIKSGLTANLTIKTMEKKGVLTVPSLAIIDNDSGTFVRELKNGKVVDVPVKVGVRSSNGNVEILSGISDGEQVINVGKKVQ